MCSLVVVTLLAAQALLEKSILVSCSLPSPK
uniref:Uncharacterized protein n=1 Tax=Arundo donax TaxID=35708 RepID=A0A0A9AA83_ARUDO